MNIIIVGGGYSGMIAAIHAKNKNNNVTIIEANNQLGRKLLTTGNGRCNITNNKNNQELIQLIHNGKFLYSTLSETSIQTIIDFYNKNGLQLIEEADNKMYPITQKAKTILQLLTNKIKQLNIEVIYNTKVVDIKVENNKVKKLITNNKDYTAEHFIFAGGGHSFPKLGSDGSLHQILNKHHVNIIKAYPVEAAIFSSDEIIKNKTLVGLSFNKIKFSVYNNKKISFETTDDLIFTHRGLSGPAALKSSEHIYKLLLSNQAITTKINFIPSLNLEKLTNLIRSYPNEQLVTLLEKHLSKRHLSYIFNTLALAKTIVNSQVTNQNILKLNDLILNFEIKISQVDDIKRAFVSGGGVDLKEINPYDYTHKKYKNLSIIGELLDLHGPIGGYNLTIAFLSGYIAGIRLSDTY